MYVRRSNDRGFVDHGWLQSHHTFSFGSYQSPEHRGFSALRVINEDRVMGGKGFETHGHRDMEIISYVLSGELGHQDTLGTRSVIRPGEIQSMSAGTGIEHSEFNHSETDQVHFLQIWIQPSQQGFPPSYEQKAVREGLWEAIVVPTAESQNFPGAVAIHQNAAIYRLKSAEKSGEFLWNHSASRPKIYLHVIEGSVTVMDHVLYPGDGLGMDGQEQTRIAITWSKPVHLLAFELIEAWDTGLY